MPNHAALSDPRVVGGAIASIIPLDVWPFYPAQTVKHYVFHGVYGLTQLPLIGVAIREVSRRGSPRAAAIEGGAR